MRNGSHEVAVKLGDISLSVLGRDDIEGGGEIEYVIVKREVVAVLQEKKGGEKGARVS